MITLWVAVAGAAGVLCRYAADLAVARAGWPAPMGTFVINLAGSMIAGFVLVAVTERAALPPQLGVVLTVGFCGGMTTFSAFMAQSLVLLERSQIGWAAVYMVASPALGLAAVFAGATLARALLAG